MGTRKHSVLSTEGQEWNEDKENQFQQPAPTRLAQNNRQFGTEITSQTNNINVIIFLF
jgi:hypothetical protein